MRKIIDVPTMAKEKVVKYYESNGKSVPYDVDKMFVVWSAKTLQNWKAIISFAVKGAPMYEITHDGDNDRTYVDIYAKVINHILVGGE